jgi:nicotinamidase-related amidase
VIFVRFLGDKKFQTPSWRERDLKQKKGLKCLEGTWGADFFRVSPLPSETVVAKPCAFDAFFNPAFERLLQRKKIGRLLLAGVYLDICVDALARTAFQKGFRISVLTDCVESLHYPKAEVLRYMTKYYGAQALASRAL